MRLYIVRHGETFANKMNICQGHSDWELSETGVAQARRIARRLSQISFDACYSSDLIRAYKTAEIIGEENCFEIIQDARLRERCLGKLQGQVFPETKIDIDSIEGVEPIGCMTERVRAFVEELSSEKSFENILIVTHGITIKVLLSVLKNIEFDYDMDMLSIKNVSLTICDVSSDGTTIELFNDVEHLL